MQHEFAKYVADLEHNLENTNRAEDRKIWERLLAEAACILSKVILDAPKEELFSAIKANEHLWGYSWIQGPVKWNNPGSYDKFKELAGYEADKTT